MRFFVSFVWLVLAAACANQVPPGIREDLPNNPLLTEVQREATRYSHQLVRWGGTIVGLRGEKTHATELEILARPLEADGQPEHGDTSPGRFLAQFAKFLDPEVYKVGRRITVFGTVQGSRDGRIGERLYPYPLISALQSHLWPSDNEDYWRTTPIQFGFGTSFGF